MTRILWHISTKKLPKMLEYTLGRVGFSDFFLNFEYLNIFLLEYNRSAHLYIFKFHSYLEICLLFWCKNSIITKFESFQQISCQRCRDICILGGEGFIFGIDILFTGFNNQLWILQILNYSRKFSIFSWLVFCLIY